LRSDKIVQFSSPLSDPELARVRYSVRIGEKFWSYLQEPGIRLLLPLELMKSFVDRPTGWDYAAFLVCRCTRARTHSVIDHDTLMALFKDSANERDSATSRRLQGYHNEVMSASGGRLNASLEPAGHFPSSGGRPKERWILRVGPSQKVVWSGKKDE